MQAQKKCEDKAIYQAAAKAAAVKKADERKRAAGIQAAKAAEKRRDLFHALQSFSKSDEDGAGAYEELQELGQAGRAYSANFHEIHTTTISWQRARPYLS